MTYIYDILLNFNEEYYDFYDWNKSDKIIHIKKIPIYKVDDNVLKDIVNNYIIFDESFLDLIKEKTEVFLKHEIKRLKYSCLLCTNEKILAINMNQKGKVIGISDLLIDEYSELVETLKDCKSIDIKYFVEAKKIYETFKTRSDKSKECFILKELNKFKDDELQYIYYEIYLENENNRNKILDCLFKYKNKEVLYNLVKYISGMYKKIK